jgi:hypothetical protein
MPISGAAEWISTGIKLSFKPLICRDIPITLATEMEDQAGGSRGRAFGGPALANFH